MLNLKSYKKHSRIVLIVGIFLFSMTLAACGAKPTPTQPPAQKATEVPPTLAPTATPEPTATNTPEPTFTPSPTVLPTQIVDDKGVTMQLVPEGEFTMGSDTNQAVAKPAHPVYVDAYYIDKYEVTNDLYRACVEAGACEHSNRSGGGVRLYNDTWNGHPVMNVTWPEAQAYCEWRGGSLPTEAQWEKAARGTDGRKFPWGNEMPTCDLARFTDCGWMTSKVGEHPAGASPFGVEDMAGNAWEWVYDWYLDDYYQNSPYENPTGPADGETVYKTERGGAWFYDARLQTSIWRNQAPYWSTYAYVGFRCAAPVK